MGPDRFVVLLSAGLDSTVNLFESVKIGKVLLALTVDYGQKAAKREIEFASKICDHLSVDHRVIQLDWLKDLGSSGLTHENSEIPKNIDIDSMEQSKSSAEKVWVPNRNGLFLNIAAAFAEDLNVKYIVPGFNLEEAQTFADNSQEFLESCTESLKYSTSNKVNVKCFTTHMNKPEIYKRAKDLEVPTELIWPCYYGEKAPCGKCESCLRFKRAQESYR